MDKIIPDMQDYAEAKYMKLVKAYNEMIDVVEKQNLEFHIHKKEILKELSFLKSASRNR
jgi:hypothetical protein